MVYKGCYGLKRCPPTAHVLKSWNPRECYGKMIRPLRGRVFWKGHRSFGKHALAETCLVYFSSSLSWIPGSWCKQSALVMRRPPFLPPSTSTRGPKQWTYPTLDWNPWKQKSKQHFNKCFSLHKLHSSSVSSQKQKADQPGAKSTVLSQTARASWALITAFFLFSCK